MPGKVKLSLVKGEMKGAEFEFDEHDTFMFGRARDCHACLPDDPAVSRHHFILEVNPPDARIRDLGSRNGTSVNGTKYGGRKKGETPEEGARRQYPEVDVHDGDQIKVGKTVISVKVEMPALCMMCGREIDDTERGKWKWPGDNYMCAGCRRKLAESGKGKEPPPAPEPVRCRACGKDVSGEIGPHRRGHYVCQECQQKAQAAPSAVLLKMIREAARVRGVKVPKIAGYDIKEEPLGVGGNGAVFLARSKKSGEKVAVKVMLAKVAVDEKSRKRFLREIDVQRELAHQNIVQLVDHGSIDSAFYFVMEFCEQGSVDDLMKRHRGKLSLKEAGPIMLQALEGLAFAHGRNFVHRDLKPHNILLGGSEGNWTSKISDFGLAKSFQVAGLSGVTVTGAMSGTPAFMPREQLTNFKYVKPVSDVWSIGATFYNMLTVRFPYEFVRGRDPMLVILHNDVVPVRSRDPNVPAAVAEVIDRAIAKDRKARYQGAGEMLDALRKAL